MNVHWFYRILSIFLFIIGFIPWYFMKTSPEATTLFAGGLGLCSAAFWVNSVSNKEDKINNAVAASYSGAAAIYGSANGISHECMLIFFLYLSGMIILLLNLLVLCIPKTRKILLGIS